MQEQNSFKASGGKLYLVPTPIGNLEDMTLRAKRILSEADYIAAEDTRTSGILLEKIGVHNKMISFHKYNSKQRAPELIERLKSGKTIAEISDAGMPVISDPGFILVQACLKADIPVISLPGPSAFATALIASGFDAQPFTYYGFLPRKPSEQVHFFEKMNTATATAIFYEAPHRLKKTLTTMQKVFSPSRQLVLARELTKIHETYLRGRLDELVAYFQRNEPRGEFVVLVSAAVPEKKEPAWSALIEEVTSQVTLGSSQKDAIKAVAQKYEISKNMLYRKYYHQG